MINNSGTFTLQGFEIDITGDDTGAINNTGLFQKTGSGTSIVNNVDFNSTTATISEVAGTLQFQDGGLWTGNHTLIGTSDLTGGTFNITDGSIFTGDLRIDGATVNLQGDFEIDTLDLVTGALNIDSLGLGSAGDTYTVGTTFSWSGNNTTASPISGGGTGILDIPLGSVFDITTWRFGATQFAELNNLTVNNAGRINLSPGTAGDSLQLTNGTMINNSGTFDLLTFEIDIIGNGTINNSGTLEKSSSGTSAISNTISYTNTGGTVNLQAGILSLGGNTLTLDAASTLMGTGTFSGNVNNSGTITPGTSPGILNIAGNLILNPSSILDIELAGTSVGTEYDRLAVTGTATLDGTLSVTEIDGFFTSVSDQFDVMTYASKTGTFATVNNSFGDTYTTPVEQATQVRLDVTATNPFITWIAGSGLWQTGTNWSGGSAPTATDDVIIPAGGITVTVSAASQAVHSIFGNNNTLAVTSGDLTVDGNSMIDGALTISGGGTLTGAGDITVNGLTSWTNPSTIGGGPSATLFANGGLDLFHVSSSNWILNRALELGGNSNWLTTGISGVRILSGSGSITNNAVLTLVPFDPGSQSEARRLQVQVPFTNTATGTVTKNGGNVGADFQMTFDNAGTVNGDDAQFLRLSGGGTHTGDFSTASGGILQFSGTPVFNSGVDFTGAGTVEFLSGTSTLATGVTYNLSGTTIVSGATVNFDSSGITSLGSLTVSSGTANLNTGNAQTLTTLSVSGGTLQGADDITVSGLTSWTNPSTIGGSGTLFANGGLDLFHVSSSNWILDRALELGGNSNWLTTGISAVRILSGTGSITNNAVLTLVPFDPGTQTEARRLQVQVPFTNTATGTVTKNGGNVGADFQMTFDNAGTVNGDDAQFLRLSGGGTHTGDFSTASGGILQFSGTPVFNSGVDFTGAGTVEFLSGTSTLATGVTYNLSGTTIISGATVNFDSSGITSLGSLTVSSGTANLNTGNAQTLTTLSVSGGTLQGADDITVSGLTSWTNPSTIGGSGTLFANGGLDLFHVSSSNWILNRALELGGNSNWLTTGISAVRILSGTGSITNNAVLTLVPFDPGTQTEARRLQVQVCPSSTQRRAR